MRYYATLMPAVFVIDGVSMAMTVVDEVLPLGEGEALPEGTEPATEDITRWMPWDGAAYSSVPLLVDAPPTTAPDDDPKPPA